MLCESPTRHDCVDPLVSVAGALSRETGRPCRVRYHYCLPQGENRDVVVQGAGVEIRVVGHQHYEVGEVCGVTDLVVVISNYHSELELKLEKV